jgi:hypothetical protein
MSGSERVVRGDIYEELPDPLACLRERGSVTERPALPLTQGS